MIDGIDGGFVKFIVINKAVEISLKKDANKDLVRKVLSDILGQSADFSIESMTKEEYAMRLLG